MGVPDPWFSLEVERRGSSVEAWWLVVVKQQFVRGTTVTALVLWERDWVRERRGESATRDLGSGSALRRRERQWLSVEARRRLLSYVSSPGGGHRRRKASSGRRWC